MATTEQVPAESNEVRTFTAENTVSQQGLKSPYRSSPSLDKASPAPSGPIIARFCKDVSFVVRSANRQSATALNDIHALPHSLTSLSLSLSVSLAPPLVPRHRITSVQQPIWFTIRAEPRATPPRRITYRYIAAFIMVSVASETTRVGLSSRIFLSFS